MRRFLLLLALVQSAPADADYWDLPPIRYSDAKAEDSLAKLAADLESGVRRVEGSTALERLKFVMRELRVPEESQILVFSKTSHQKRVDRSEEPAVAVFFENAYVGYVPGGVIEAVVQDPDLGPVFYTIEAGAKDGLKIERDLSTCMSCHGTTRTEGVPGLQVRSVFPNVDGHPLWAMGTSHVNHDTPVQGAVGWLLRGRAGARCLIWEIALMRKMVMERRGRVNLADVSGLIDTSKYPKADERYRGADGAGASMPGCTT